LRVEGHLGKGYVSYIPREGRRVTLEISPVWPCSLHTTFRVVALKTHAVPRPHHQYTTINNDR
jgi:hypothetical protein